ncbi:MAG: guanylate cyclase [Odoribacter sp.]|nr:guanylate cyclase [Odoribacter sp.]
MLDFFKRALIIIVFASPAASQPVVSVYSVYDQKSVPVLSRVIIDNDSILFPVSVKADNEIIRSGKLRLKNSDNNIAFEILADRPIEYQYMLKGYSNEWSSWQNYNYKEYTNLRSGHYIFMVRYRDTENLAGSMNNVSFTVLPEWFLSLPAIAIYFILLVLVVWALYDQLNFRFARKQYSLEQIINNRTEDLIREKEKTETLLSNVLPKNTADEIMAKGKATKIKYNFVTVLFSDIQGFTKIAEEMNPEVLIDELDKFFFHFDSVVEKYSIEKIKTIGDAYMCAGGIPERNRTNPVEVILAALEMQQYMLKLKEASEIEGMKFWDIRIGIHTGTVIAGVVGQKKLSYDIWGDTVNTASRMESSGDAGKINISGTTYEFVKDFFVCEHRGKMPVKYKGELDMYFVNGIVDGLKDENNGPSFKFILKMQLIKLQDIEEYVLKMFDEEAPPNLYFHNTSLVKNTGNQVDLLSNAEKLDEEEYIDLRLASIFLFTGFISDYDKPMEGACQIAEEVLPKFGFSKKNVDAAKKIIINSFGEKQESLSDNILHDAKYDYFGRVDFIKLTEKLLKEETEYGMVRDRKEWIRNQSKLLSEHEFITNTAKLLMGVPVGEQAAIMEAFIKEAK